MKTIDLKRVCFISISAIILFLALTSCGSDSPAKMYWKVSSLDQDNVEITFDGLKNPQIEIVVNSEGGECMLACSNYRTLAFRGHASRSNVFQDFDCQYYAEITSPGIIRMRFDKMPQRNNEIVNYFIIDGVYGENFSNTVVKVTRKLHDGKDFK